MADSTTAPVVETARADAVVLTDRLRRGQPLPRIGRTGLLEGEHATLETHAHVDQWWPSREAPSGEARSPVPVVVTTRRILVARPHRPGLSLWHLDLENLQLGLTEGRWHLDLHPVGINPRVRLTGASTPLVAVHVAHTVFPATWARLSGLLPLLDSAA